MYRNFTAGPRVGPMAIRLYSTVTKIDSACRINRIKARRKIGRWPKSCFEPNSHGISTNIDKQNGWEFQIAISTKFGCKGWVRPELTQSCHARLGEAKLAILAVSFLLLLHLEDYLLWGMAVPPESVDQQPPQLIHFHPFSMFGRLCTWLSQTQLVHLVL